MIKEMQAYGLTPDEMLKVIKLAREQYKELKKTPRPKRNLSEQIEIMADEIVEQINNKINKLNNK